MIMIKTKKTFGCNKSDCLVGNWGKVVTARWGSLTGNAERSLKDRKRN